MDKYESVEAKRRLAEMTKQVKRFELISKYIISIERSGIPPWEALDFSEICDCSLADETLNNMKIKALAKVECACADWLFHILSDTDADTLEKIAELKIKRK